MSTALQKQQPGETMRYGFSSSQIDTIRSQIAPNASNEELELFLIQCQRTNLDPFSRQIYLSERVSWDKNRNQWITKKTAETTIDGFRVVAERSGEYQGQTEPEWCGEDGEWRTVWLAQGPPAAARVGVYRKGFSAPVYAVALYREYVQTTKDGKVNSMWSKMPANQLLKCAEALALRKAFPRDLSGLYSKEEMGQQENPEVGTREAQVVVAESKIRQLEAARTPEPADDGGYAERHAALINEGAAALEDMERQLKDEPKKKSSAKNAALSAGLTDVLKGFGDLKRQIVSETGSDVLYYEALKQGGYEKSSAITDRNEGRRVYKIVAAAFTEYRRIQTDREELRALYTSLTAEGKLEAFWRAMGAHGQENVEEADPASLGAILTELRTL